MATDHVARQVFDLPEPQPLDVTEHRDGLPLRWPAACADTSGLPEGVAAPMRMARINAVVLYLLHYQLLPEKRSSEAMAHLFGVHLVTATIAPTSDCAQRLQCFADALVRSRGGGLGQAHG